MRLVLMSDTHGHHRKISIPDGDILIHAGDVCRTGELSELAEINRFFGAMPHRHRLLVAGNHDFCLERQPEEARALLTNATYLLDESVELCGWRFHGSPWQPEFMNFAFNLPRGRALREKWDMIPPNTDVLITHGPPRGVLDTTFSGLSVGCRDLLEAVGRLQPKLHVYGHIHESRGIRKIGPTTFVNASICDAAFRPSHTPLVIDLDLPR